MKPRVSSVRCVSAFGPLCLLGLAGIAPLTALGGCGGSTKVETRSTTTGQELQDLEEARNKGLLTEDEYQAKRRQIMDRK